jgi:hypothetical protein
MHLHPPLIVPHQFSLQFLDQIKHDPAFLMLVIAGLLGRIRLLICELQAAAQGRGLLLQGEKLGLEALEVG